MNKFPTTKVRKPTHKHVPSEILCRHMFYEFDYAFDLRWERKLNNGL